YIAIGYLCTALGNIAISAILVERMGLIGVAIGTLIPSAALSLCAWAYTIVVLDVSIIKLFRQLFLPVIFPLLPMLSVFYAAKQMQWAPDLIVTGSLITAA